MQKIIPHLWFDHQAEEAVNFYVSIFDKSKIGFMSRYGDEAAAASGRPKGSVMIVAFEIEGQEFMALNGGPMFSFTPAVSFFVNCATRVEIDKLWEKLSAGGEVMMKFDTYPFSEKYGWVKDKYGVSWQLNLATRAQKIAPCLMFTGGQAGKAEEAIKRYVSLFKNSSIEMMVPYDAADGDIVGTVKHAEFTLDGQLFMGMDSHLVHGYTFTHAVIVARELRDAKRGGRAVG